VRVYIESNFPLELARRQEEVADAEDLLKLAEAQRIELVYPAIALTEPFSTLLRYANERSRVLQTLNHQLSDLARSQPHQPLVASMAPVVKLLTNLRKDETDLLEQVVDRILKVGRAVPLTASIFAAARAAEMQFDLSPQDAIIYASVVEDLDSGGVNPPVSCFLSKNSKDFGVTRSEFAKRNCTYIAKFAAGGVCPVENQIVAPNYSCTMRVCRYPCIWRLTFWITKISQMDERNPGFEDHDDFPIVWLWYSALIELTCHEPKSERLLEGAGNLIDPAGAFFTACWLTSVGRVVAEKVIEQHSEWKSKLTGMQP
jgi:predicted nucleic acid-binding protein